MTDLFREFDGISDKEWKQKIQVDLKGADYNESLIWQSDEGIDVKPFYSKADCDRKIDVPLPDQPPKNSQFFFFKKTKKTFKAIEKAVNNGVDHCHIMVAENRLDSLNDLMKELSDSDMDLLLEFERIPNAHHDSFFSTLGSKDFDLDIDILGNFARTGNWYYDKVTDHQLLKTHIDNKNNRSVLSVSTDLYQNAGANIIQQLAYGLAHMNEYLNHYQDGINLKPLFKVGVGSNYFFEIAKIRALRALWRSLSEVYSVADKCLIMAIPSRRNKTIYDYNNNMIRTTLECMSAKLGGADIIQNLPYDALYHKSNDFGERIARNQPLILKHESYFNAVLNAAEGSYYIESITTQLAEKALALFRTIEESGGLLQQLNSGTIQRKIRESGHKEQEQFDLKAKVLIGSNTYENPDEHMGHELQLYPFVKTKIRKTEIEPVIERRLSEAIEKIKLENEN